jgi:hypothetical protein
MNMAGKLVAERVCRLETAPPGKICTQFLVSRDRSLSSSLSHARIYAGLLGGGLSKTTYMSHVV